MPRIGELSRIVTSRLAGAGTCSIARSCKCRCKELWQLQQPLQFRFLFLMSRPQAADLGHAALPFDMHERQHLWTQLQCGRNMLKPYLTALFHAGHCLFWSFGRLPFQCSGWAFRLLNEFYEQVMQGQGFMRF